MFLIGWYNWLTNQNSPGCSHTRMWEHSCSHPSSKRTLSLECCSQSQVGENKLSPAMCVFGRPTRDFIPILPGRYRPHDTWRETLAAQEEALRNRHMRAAERWSEHTKTLRPLVVSDQVRIQNQTGPNPRKWDKTGHVIEVCQHDQYVIWVDGSGRVTLRRKFLRKYIPVQPPRPRLGIMGDLRGHTPQPHPSNTGEYLQKHVHIAQPTPSNMMTTTQATPLNHTPQTPASISKSMCTLLSPHLPTWWPLHHLHLMYVNLVKYHPTLWHPEVLHKPHSGKPAEISRRNFSHLVQLHHPMWDPQPPAQTRQDRHPHA